MKITYAEEKDITAITAVEAACFPPAEAATEQEFVERIKYYSNHFWLLYDADELIRRAIADARQQSRKGLVLTCKERLIAYYAKFGFVDEGVSEKSTHGNVRWHQMRLMF